MNNEGARVRLMKNLPEAQNKYNDVITLVYFNERVYQAKKLNYINIISLILGEQNYLLGLYPP